MSNPLNVGKSNIFIIKDGLDESMFFSLHRPGHEQKTKFYINTSLKKLYEIQALREEYNSWLIDETLRTNGDVFLITPIDPLFIILPHFKKQCSNRAVPYDHILRSADDPELSKLEMIVCDLNNVGDMKGPASLAAYKYSEEKALNWLKKKVECVAKALQKRNVYVKSGAISATFVASSIKENDIDEYESYTKFALGMVTEYLNDEFSNLLEKQYKFKEEENTIGKRKSSAGTETLSKKVKMIKTESQVANNEPEETKPGCSDSNTKPKPKKSIVSPKSVQDKKAAVGTKSISSFFFKK